MTDSNPHQNQNVSDSPDERRGHAATAAAAKRTLDAVTTIIAALKDLSEPDKIRVLKSTATFYGILHHL